MHVASVAQGLAQAWRGHRTCLGHRVCKYLSRNLGPAPCVFPSGTRSGRGGHLPRVVLEGLMRMGPEDPRAGLVRLGLRHNFFAYEPSSGVGLGGPSGAPGGGFSEYFRKRVALPRGDGAKEVSSDNLHSLFQHHLGPFTPAWVRVQPGWARGHLRPLLNTKVLAL